MSLSELRPQGRPAVTYERIHVTPDMATRWLEGNTHNRKLVQGHVDRLAKDMEEGRWLDNGETVKFDNSGVLLDGQHRLWAIVQSNIAQTMIVVYNVPRSAQATMDIGRIRSAADILGMESVPNPTLLAAIAHNVLRYDRIPGVVWSGPDSTFTKTEIVEFSRDHGAGLHDAVLYANDVTNVRLKTAAYGAAAYVIRRKHGSTFDHFHEKVKTGVDLKANDPRLILRNYGMNRRQMGGFETQALMAVTIKAFNDFYQGLDRKQLRFGRHELPMPEII